MDGKPVWPAQKWRARCSLAFNGLTWNGLMWPNIIAGLGWMPWVVLAVERAWRGGGGRSIVLAAVLAAGMQLLVGRGRGGRQLTWMFLGCWWLAQMFRPEIPALAGWRGGMWMAVGGLWRRVWPPLYNFWPFFDLGFAFTKKRGVRRLGHGCVAADRMGQLSGTSVPLLSESAGRAVLLQPDQLGEFLLSGRGCGGAGLAGGGGTRQSAHPPASRAGIVQPGDGPGQPGPGL